MLETDISGLNQQFESIVEVLSLSARAADSDESKQMLEMIQALRQNIQIMLRLESDVRNNKDAGLSEKEITEIADYALNLMDEIAASCGSRGMQTQMLDLHRLSLPVVAWLKQYHGTLNKLDIVVNAIASYANTLQDSKKLEELAALIEKTVQVTDQSIKQDLEASNPMRPWRILNLNWGIVATRSHNTELMKYVFDRLIKNIPADAQQFFYEGVQQMDIVGYPDHVREVMQKYAADAGSNSVLH